MIARVYIANKAPSHTPEYHLHLNIAIAEYHLLPAADTAEDGVDVALYLLNCRSADTAEYGCVSAAGSK